MTEDVGVAVFEAIEAGDIERVRELIERDPSAASARDEDGLSAALQARYRDRTDMVEVLLGAGIELDLFEAAAVGATARSAELLSEEASAIDGWSVDGFTPLHLAAFFGHMGTVRLLLERGADPMAVSRNPMEVTPLHSTLAGSDAAGRPPIAELLLDRGADVDARTHGGFTPLMEAAQNGDLDTARLLLARGADRTLRNDRGQSAYDLAVARGHDEVAELLRAPR